MRGRGNGGGCCGAEASNWGSIDVNMEGFEASFSRIMASNLYVSWGRRVEGLDKGKGGLFVPCSSTPHIARFTTHIVYNQPVEYDSQINFVRD